MRFPELKKHIEILLEHQTEEGGFLASKEYEPYKKVWLRDHSHISLSLLRVGKINAVKRAANFSIKILLPFFLNIQEKPEIFYPFT